MAVDVDGRWSIICCTRAVAVLMVDVVVVGEGGNGTAGEQLEW